MELAAAEPCINRLPENRYELNAQLNSTSLIMTSLPLDMLTEIFTHICERDPSSLYAARLPGQFVIGGVCRAWRHVAWSTPRLWSHVFLTFSSSRYETQRNLLQDWIGRTADCLLHLHFAMTSVPWEPPVDFFLSILQTCSRWSTFNYQYRSTNFPLALQHEPNFVFSSLSSLSLVGEVGLEDPKDKWKFCLPPQLRTLVLLWARQSALDINWGSLTDLTVTTDLGSLRAILALSDSLGTLKVSVLTPVASIATNGRTPCCLPHLKIVSISGFPRNVGGVIRFMTAPVLKDLELEMFEDLDDDASYPWNEDLADMARRSNSQLKNLTFRQTTISQESELLVILHNIPSIERFEFDCSDTSIFSLSNRILDELNPNIQAEDEGLGLLPNLTFFKYYGRISFTLDSLQRMIIARFESLQRRHSPSHRGISEDPSTTDLDSDSEKLCIEINYSNATWYRRHHPNELQTFYTAITPLWDRGLSFNLECDPDEEESGEED